MRAGPIVALGLAAAAQLAADISVSVSQYEEAITRGDFAAAEQVAEALLGEAVNDHGQKSAEAGIALGRLGDAQYAAQDLTAAVQSYTSAVSLVESAYSPTHPALYPLLDGLGNALLAEGEAAGAVAAFDRALTISRRSEGLFNLAQLPALRAIAEAYSVAGRLEKAQNSLTYLVRINEQRFGRNDVRTGFAVAELARWHARAGHYVDSRSLYKDAIRIIRQASGGTSPDLIEPLSGLGDVYRREMLGQREFEAAPEAPGAGNDFTPRTRDELMAAGANNYSAMLKLHPAGIRAVAKAVQIATRLDNADKVSPVRLVDLYLQIGDLEQLSGDTAAAVRHYRQAGEIENAQARDRTAQALAAPVPLYLPMPMQALAYASAAEEQVSTSYALFEYSVTPNGRVDAIDVLEGDASEGDVREATRGLERAIYRPRFEAGEPTAASNVRYRMVFRHPR